MSDVYTDSTAWANFITTGYDRAVEFQLRSEPCFRQFVDKRPVNVTTPGSAVVLSIAQEYAALATTPLGEDADVAAVAPPAPVRVTVTPQEYGNASVESLRLEATSFTAVDPIVANLIGKNMVDTHDALVRAIADAATHIIGRNAGTIKTDSSSFAEASVAGTDILNAATVQSAVSLLRRRNAHPRDIAGNYAAVVHPDVAYDIMSDTSWLSPHQYVDPTNIYNAELGAYMGARFVQSPRCTVVNDGASGAHVYRTYFLGQQALVEAVVREPQVVIGPVVDRLMRFRTIGWKSFLGWAIYRQEAIQVARTASSIAAL